MSERIIRKLLDDMEEAAGQEVEADVRYEFSVRGKPYEIDLSAKNAAKLDALLQPWVDNARSAGKGKTKVHLQSSRKSGGPSGYSSEQLTAIREWARGTSWPNLSDKGRVPGEVLVAFEQAHAGEKELFSAL